MRIGAALSLAFLIGAILCVAATAAERVKLEPIYKVSRLSNTEVGISCMNGADPTGKKIGNTVIMSCGSR